MEKEWILYGIIEARFYLREIIPNPDNMPKIPATITTHMDNNRKNLGFIMKKAIIPRPIPTSKAGMKLKV